MQKNFKFDATFDRKPVQLLENWCDVVTAWCDGNYPGSDVLYQLELLQVFEGKSNLYMMKACTSDLVASGVR